MKRIFWFTSGRFTHIPAFALQLVVLMLASYTSASAMTLDEVYANFQKCEFKNFYYSPWDTKSSIHPYLLERNLKPYREENGVYYFKVKDTLFGLPVSEIVIPGTWNFHGIIFDVPLAKAQAVFKRRFGTTFAPSQKSEAGEVPALAETYDSAKSTLYCSGE